MVRHYFLVLIISVLLASCAVDFPVEYYISSSCLKNPDEAQAIQDAAEEWNKATCKEFFRYIGIDNDDRFNMNDLQDGKLVVYCVEDTENPDVNKLQELSPVPFTAYSIGDIIIKRQAVKEEAPIRYQVVDHHPDTDPLPNDYYLKYFKGLMAHEFGHQLGLGHNNDERGYSVMNPSLVSSASTLAPTLLDIEGSREMDGLCDLYDCPPADECPTRPVF